MDDSLLARLRAAGAAGSRRPVRRSRPARPGRWPRSTTTRTEARWGPGEVLAHLAEMAPYWLGEIERVLDGAGGARAVRPGRDRPGAHRARSSVTGPCRRASCTTGSTTRLDRFDRRWRSLTPADLAPARGPPEAWRDDRGADAGSVHRRPPRGPRGPARLDPRGRSRRRLSAAGPARCSSSTRSRSGSSRASSSVGGWTVSGRSACTGCR